MKEVSIDASPYERNVSCHHRQRLVVLTVVAATMRLYFCPWRAARIRLAESRQAFMSLGFAESLARKKDRKDPPWTVIDLIDKRRN